jgi:putative oxidoreductase
MHLHRYGCECIELEAVVKLDMPSAAYAALLMRVSLGVMFLAHSVVLKYLTFTLPGTAQFFESIGLPGWLAYTVFAAEAVGGVLLIFGVQVRLVALALLPILAGALWVHAGNGWVFSSSNGGWEYPLYFIVLTLAQVLLGEGAFALAPSMPLLRLPSVEAFRGQT